MKKNDRRLEQCDFTIYRQSTVKRIISMSVTCFANFQTSSKQAFFLLEKLIDWLIN